VSIRSAADETPSPARPDPVDRLAFIGNVHRLIARGYGRVSRQGYCRADENLLNQDFIAALRGVVDDPGAPPWAIHFSIHEKRKQNDGQRIGNARLELDIVFERTGRGVHPRFSIEAKRLGPAHPAGTYLGPKGLGAFLSGEYAPEHDEAGMLGYVQSNTVSAWCNALADKLGDPSGGYGVKPDGKWQRQAFRDGPKETFRTRHARSGGRGSITVFHTLLDFTA
jgi:hypothetical protein